MKTTENKYTPISVSQEETWKKKAFTLVELIIVITILAILATLAFMSFQWYSSQSRDSNRMTTVKNIEKGVNIFITKTGKVPEPDDAWMWNLDGTILSRIWWVGTNISRQINMNEVPLDPKVKEKYMYWVDVLNRYYQVATVLEWDIAMIPWVRGTYAWNKYQAKVDWNYEYPLNYLWKIYSLPSLLFLGSGALTWSTQFIVDKGNNVPYSFWDATWTQNVTEVLKIITWTWNLSLTGISIPSIMSTDYKSSEGIPEVFSGLVSAIGVSNKNELWTAIYGRKYMWDSASIPSSTWIPLEIMNSIPENGICWSAKGTSTIAQPNVDSLCSSWSVANQNTTASGYTWDCEWLNYGDTVHCSATRQYVVTFNSNSGSVVTSQTMSYGWLINTPTSPTRGEDSFWGWYKEVWLTHPWSFESDTVTGTVILYAKWISTAMVWGGVEWNPRKMPDGTVLKNCQEYNLQMTNLNNGSIRGNGSCGTGTLACLSDGKYMIDIDGTGSMTSFSVYCNMNSGGGGRTRISYNNSTQENYQRFRDCKTNWYFFEINFECVNPLLFNNIKFTRSWYTDHITPTKNLTWVDRWCTHTWSYCRTWWDDGNYTMRDYNHSLWWYNSWRWNNKAWLIQNEIVVWWKE